MNKYCPHYLLLKTLKKHYDTRWTSRRFLQNLPTLVVAQQRTLDGKIK